MKDLRERFLGEAFFFIPKRGSTHMDTAPKVISMGKQ